MEPLQYESDMAATRFKRFVIISLVILVAALVAAHYLPKTPKKPKQEPAVSVTPM